MASSNYKTLSEAQATILHLQSEIAKAQEFIDEAHKLPEVYRLAEELHALKCHANHTDGCDWAYESWYAKSDHHLLTRDELESTYARKMWYEKAENLLKYSDYDTIVKIAKVI